MKRKFLSLISVTFILIFSLSFLSLAVTAETGDYLRLYDAADIIKDEDETAINEKLNALSEEWNFDFVAHTTSSLGEKDIVSYSDDYFDYNGFGVGADRSGVVLVISMSPKECYISARGEGTKYFDYDDCQLIIDDFYEELKSGEYADVCSIFAESAKNRLDEGRNENTFSYKIRSFISQWQTTVLIPLIIGIILSVITVGAITSKNKSVKMNLSANNYQEKGSLVLTKNEDYFTYKNVTRKPKAQENSSNGSSIGSSKSHSSSSGASHSGGGRSF